MQRVQGSTSYFQQHLTLPWHDNASSKRVIVKYCLWCFTDCFAGQCDCAFDWSCASEGLATAKWAFAEERQRCEPTRCTRYVSNCRNLSNCDTCFQFHSGETALMHAARLNCRDAVTWLVLAGAQTDITNYDDMRARDMTLDAEIDEVLGLHETCPPDKFDDFLKHLEGRLSPHKARPQQQQPKKEWWAVQNTCK